MRIRVFSIFIVGALVMANSTNAFRSTFHSTFPKCHIEISSPQRLTEGIWLTFSLNNNTNQDLLLLPWFTPLEGFMSNLFEITDLNGNKLLYQVPMIKRMTPTTDDFVLWKEGTVLSRSLDLTQAYKITSGRYHIQFNAPYVAIRPPVDTSNAHGASESAYFSCRSEQLMFEVL